MIWIFYIGIFLAAWLALTLAIACGVSSGLRTFFNDREKEKNQ